MTAGAARSNVITIPGLRWYIIGVVFLATLINFIDRLVEAAQLIKPPASRGVFDYEEEIYVHPAHENYDGRPCLPSPCCAGIS